ncbi:MAG: hydrogenase expression protein HupK [Thermoprotei archaeon]|nr:MAG: hydrogenase expression protein HupK [Thermoprotei archaeon]
MVHEWALAEAIANYVREYIGEKTALKKLTISLGELQSIDKDILDFALKEIFKSMGITVQELDYEIETAVLKCRKCGHEWELNKSIFGEDVLEAIHFVPEIIHSYFKCPKCSSRDFDVIRGRGIRIVRIEVV